MIVMEILSKKGCCLFFFQDFDKLTHINNGSKIDRVKKKKKLKSHGDDNMIMILNLK